MFGQTGPILAVLKISAILVRERSLRASDSRVLTKVGVQKIPEFWTLKGKN